MKMKGAHDWCSVWRHAPEVPTNLLTPSKTKSGPFSAFTQNAGSALNGLLEDVSTVLVGMTEVSPSRVEAYLIAPNICQPILLLQ
jgi:hypothetical protein